MVSASLAFARPALDALLKPFYKVSIAHVLIASLSKGWGVSRDS